MGTASISKNVSCRCKTQVKLPHPDQTLERHLDIRMCAKYISYAFPDGAVPSVFLVTYTKVCMCRVRFCLCMHTSASESHLISFFSLKFGLCFQTHPTRNIYLLLAVNKPPEQHSNFPTMSSQLLEVSSLGKGTVLPPVGDAWKM